MTQMQEMTVEQQAQEQQRQMAARAGEIRTNAILEDLARQNSELSKRNAIMAGDLAVKDDLIEQLRTTLIELDQKHNEFVAATAGAAKEPKKTK